MKQLARPTGEVVMNKRESEKLRRQLRFVSEHDREILRRLIEWQRRSNKKYRH